MVKNPKSEESRKDDVTIEKVQLSKEQLDVSLFEYEKSKGTRYPAKQINKQRTKVSILSIEKIQNLLKKCDLNAENDMNNLYNSKKISVKNFNKKYSKLIERINNLTLEKTESAPREEEVAEPINLNELYKWEEVKKEEDKSKVLPETTDPYNFYDYYSYYYQYYFNKYLNS